MTESLTGVSAQQWRLFPHKGKIPNTPQLMSETPILQESLLLFSFLYWEKGLLSCPATLPKKKFQRKDVFCRY